jgi:MoaA/NifB/PqqE/SkfB family radical SAM enzyme
MAKLNFLQVAGIVKQGALNLIRKYPLAISLEVIHSCNCNCRHCDKGGMIPGEQLAPPERFGDVVRELRPLIAQVSGGEPLLRDDIFDIVRAVKTNGQLPYVVLVTNAWLLNEEKYLRFKEIGVNEFSISLDFPDERHDENRGIPGLYAHLSELLPKLASYGHRDITLISVIRKETVPELMKLAEHAIRWNVRINFSAYTPLRTGDEGKSVKDPVDLQLLRQQIDRIIAFKRQTGKVFTSEYVLNRYYDFFASGSYLPNCRAGYRSLVVNPDGRLVPCAMVQEAYATRDELVNRFTRTNRCGGCYVSLRANTEKSLVRLIRDAWGTYRQFRKEAACGTVH